MSCGLDLLCNTIRNTQTRLEPSSQLSPFVLTVDQGGGTDCARLARTALNVVLYWLSCQKHPTKKNMMLKIQLLVELLNLRNRYSRVRIRPACARMKHQHCPESAAHTGGRDQKVIKKCLSKPGP